MELDVADPERFIAETIFVGLTPRAGRAETVGNNKSGGHSCKGK